MSINSLPSTRRQLLGAVIVLTALAASAGVVAAQPAQTWPIKPDSVEERLHDSNGRESDLQIARSRPSQLGEAARRMRDERSTWSIKQWDEYARSMAGQ